MLDWLRRHKHRKAHAALRAATASSVPPVLRPVVSGDPGETPSGPRVLPSDVEASGVPAPIVTLEVLLAERAESRAAAERRAGRLRRLGRTGGQRLAGAVLNVERLLSDVVLAVSGQDGPPLSPLVSSASAGSCWSPGRAHAHAADAADAGSGEDAAQGGRKRSRSEMGGAEAASLPNSPRGSDGGALLSRGGGARAGPYWDVDAAADAAAAALDGAHGSDDAAAQDDGGLLSFASNVAALVNQARNRAKRPRAALRARRAGAADASRAIEPAPSASTSVAVASAGTGTDGASPHPPAPPPHSSSSTSSSSSSSSSSSLAPRRGAGPRPPALHGESPHAEQRSGTTSPLTNPAQSPAELEDEWGRIAETLAGTAVHLPLFKGVLEARARAIDGRGPLARPEPGQARAARPATLRPGSGAADAAAGGDEADAPSDGAVGRGNAAASRAATSRPLAVAAAAAPPRSDGADPAARDSGGCHSGAAAPGSRDAGASQRQSGDAVPAAKGAGRATGGGGGGTIEAVSAFDSEDEDEAHELEKEAEEEEDGQRSDEDVGGGGAGALEEHADGDDAEARPGFRSSRGDRSAGVTRQSTGDVDDAASSPDRVDRLRRAARQREAWAALGAAAAGPRGPASSASAALAPASAATDTAAALPCARSSHLSWTASNAGAEDSDHDDPLASRSPARLAEPRVGSRAPPASAAPTASGKDRTHGPGPRAPESAAGRSSVLADRLSRLKGMSPQDAIARLRARRRAQAASAAAMTGSGALPQR